MDYEFLAIYRLVHVTTTQTLNLTSSFALASLSIVVAAGHLLMSRRGHHKKKKSAVRTFHPM